MADNNGSQPVARATKPVSEALLNEKVLSTPNSLSCTLARTPSFVSMAVCAAYGSKQDENSRNLENVWSFGLIRNVYGYENYSGTAPSPP